MFVWVGLGLCVGAWALLPMTIVMQTRGPAAVRLLPSIRTVLRALGLLALAASIFLGQAGAHPVAIGVAIVFLVLSVLTHPDVLFDVLDEPPSLPAAPDSNALRT